jgi:hypothetical protein
VCVFFKARGGAAMALNVLGKFLESSRVWAGKVLGKLRGYVGVESAWKVRGKFGVRAK